MTAFEPWVVGDTYPNVGSRSAISAALGADIRALSAARDMAEIVPVKVVFDSVVGILALIRVRVPAPPIHYTHSLATQLGWADRRRRVRGTSEVLCSSVSRVEDRDRREGCG
jgi:hypothetical protein